MDSDLIWFSHLVLNRPLIKSDLDYADLNNTTLNIWGIPVAPKWLGGSRKSILLLRSDYHEQYSGESRFTLVEALRISDRMLERFGLSLMTKAEWAGIYSYTSSLIGFDSQTIAKNLNMLFSDEVAYWTSDYRIHVPDRIGFGDAFTLTKSIRGLRFVERHQSSKLPIRLCVTDRDRFYTVVSQEGIPILQENGEISDDAFILPF